MEYNFDQEDLQNSFEFGLKYFLNPSKATVDRTTGKDRQFGAILDAFMTGKLVEIGVQKILKIINSSKDYVLDFAIKSTKEAQKDEDIIKVIENEIERDPKLHVEIKTTFVNERWIGITKEQLETMKAYKKDREIIIIFATLNKDPSRKSDLLGMFLKSETDSTFFNDFNDLNVSIKIDYAVSSRDLEIYGTEVLENELIYETKLFPPYKVKNAIGKLANNMQLIEKCDKCQKSIIVPLYGSNYKKYHKPERSEFNIEGSYELYAKQFKINKGTFIFCTQDTIVANDIFGSFSLDKNQGYKFNLSTLGRNPVTERNNLWFSKRRFLQLLEQGIIENPHKMLERIAEDI